MKEASLQLMLLRQTKETSRCLVSDITEDAEASESLVKEMLTGFHEAELITLADKEIHLDPKQRMRIAESLIARGGDAERVARQLRWQEFEALAEQVLIQSEHFTTTHFIFKSAARRFEIDVLGARNPLVLCIDCKHWHHGWAPSKIVNAAKNQLVRVQFLSQNFRAYAERLRTVGWRSVRLLPVVLALADVSTRLVNGVPVVPALRFGTFLSEINPWVEKLRFVDVPASQLGSASRVSRDDGLLLGF